MANQQGSRESGNKASSSGDNNKTRSSGSGQSSGGDTTKQGSRTRGGTSQQHAEAGRQSHKNDDKK
jgi:hypothetical protein